MKAAIFLSSFFIPWAFLVGSWWATQTLHVALRAVASALCVLLSLAIGFAIDMTVIGWRFVLEPGHNPGWGVALMPLVAGWITCWVGWLGFVTVAAFRRKNSN